MPDHLLKQVLARAGSHALPISGFDARCHTSADFLIWLCGCETPHKEAILKAVGKLWLHKEEVFQDLQPVAASLLRLRIELADSLILGFVTKEPCPIDYPDGAFREVVEWLLVDWWGSRGIQAVRLACVSARD